ncbi:MAG: hypothetical protein J6V24_02670, partial [Clostridia bacterium]|nr:hypothetical protein [Clostridia bacterium]
MKRKLTGANLMRSMNGIDPKWIELAYDEDEIKSAAEAFRRETGRARMTRLFGAECRKILGAKVVWVFLALNTFLAWRAAGNTAEAYYHTGLAARFFEGYFENRTEYEARYAEI